MKKHLLATFIFSCILYPVLASGYPQSTQGDSINKPEQVRVDFPAGKEVRNQINRAVKYPPNALYNNIAGQVEATFRINEEGTTIEPTIVTSAHPLLDRAVTDGLRFFKNKQMKEVRERQGEGPFLVSFNFMPENLDTTKTIEVFPQYPGGELALGEFALNNLKYPKSVKRNSVSGNIEVLADITADGQIENPRVLDSPDNRLNEAVLDIVARMPPLKPAQRKREAVACRFVLEIPVGEDAELGEMEAINFPDQQPVFKSGQYELLQYIGRNLMFPRELMPVVSPGTPYRSIVTFVVDRFGNVTNVRLVRSAGYDQFDQEALRVVRKMPKWHPGFHKGKLVRVKYTLPVTFKK